MAELELNVTSSDFEGSFWMLELTGVSGRLNCFLSFSLSATVSYLEGEMFFPAMDLVRDVSREGWLDLERSPFSVSKSRLIPLLLPGQSLMFLEPVISVEELHEFLIQKTSMEFTSCVFAINAWPGLVLDSTGNKLFLTILGLHLAAGQGLLPLVLVPEISGLSSCISFFCTASVMPGSTEYILSLL